MDLSLSEEQKQIKALETKIQALEDKLGIQQDIEEIRRLQYVYGYYMDANLNNRVLDLFSDNPAVSAGDGRRRRRRPRTAAYDLPRLDNSLVILVGCGGANLVGVNLACTLTEPNGGTFIGSTLV
jgi:hypothetical protein